MSIQKMSHKALKEMGKALNGYYYDGNIYSHENRVYYLSNIWREYRKSERLEECRHHSPEIEALAEEIAALDIDGSRTAQLAYSCGYYGNSGQLHKIDYFKDDAIVRTIYIYV